MGQFQKSIDADSNSQLVTTSIDFCGTIYEYRFSIELLATYWDGIILQLVEVLWF